MNESKSRLPPGQIYSSKRRVLQKIAQKGYTHNLHSLHHQQCMK
jgi:hypothetical protein